MSKMLFQIPHPLGGEYYQWGSLVGPEGMMTALQIRLGDREQYLVVVVEVLEAEEHLETNL